jgi:hypothetical protein
MSDTTPIAVIVDCTDGTVTERALTAEEIAQREADAAAAAAAEAERLVEEAARQAAREAAIARFKTLGFTDEEIATLVLP